MKLKLIRKKKYKIIKYNILKSKIYLQIKQNKSLNTNMEQFEIYLKQLIKLIYEYHHNNKCIYFIDFPVVNNKELLQKAVKNNHKFFSSRMLVKKIKSKTLLETNLLIVFTEELDRLVCNHFKTLNIPIIIINKFSFFDFSRKKVYGNGLINKKIFVNLFYSIFQKLKIKNI